MKRRVKFTATKVYGKFMGFIVGAVDKAALNAIEILQKSLDYSMEENKVYKEMILELTGKKRIS